jgi:hypothetical protein
MQTILRRMELWDTRTVLYVLVGMALFSLGFSAFSHWMNGEIHWWEWMDGATQNFSTEMMGAIVTFGLFEIIVGTRHEKTKLILQFGSQDNATALNAARLLKANGWLVDGSLQGTSLYKANLSGVSLYGANLIGVSLFQANLQNANLWKANLRDANLWSANLQLNCHILVFKQ